MTGAAGRLALEGFYADQFLPHVPSDSAVYWPSSQRPGAMSLAAWAGPHEPGA